MTKKVIVSGANGFIGRYLLRELIKAGYEVWSIIRDISEDLSSIEVLNTHIIYCDLIEIFRLSELINERKFECFYHLAWAGSSGAGRKDYELQLANAKSCADAAKVAAQLKCKKFVGAGSVTELMYRNYLKQDGSKPEMITCYAIGKMAAEYLSKCVCTEEKIDFMWGYISNSYGAEDSTQNFLRFLLDNYLSNTIPRLTAGDQKADFIYVSDVARALISMSERGKPGKSYYIGYGNPRPLKEFVTEIRNIVNPNIDTGLGLKPFQGMDIDFDSLNIRRLNADTGFIPLIDFRAGIRLMLNWIEENNAGNKLLG